MRYTLPLVLLLLAGCNGQPDHPGYDRVGMDVTGKTLGERGGNIHNFDGGYFEFFREDGSWSLARGGWDGGMDGTWSRDYRGRICVKIAEDGQSPSWFDRSLCRHIYRKDDGLFIEEVMRKGEEEELGDLLGVHFY